MNGTTLAFILLRLAAVLFAYQGLALLPALIGVVLREGEAAPLEFGAWAVPIAFYCALFFILWFGARRIGQKVAGGELDQTDEISATGTDFLQSGIILLGVYLIVLTIPRMISVFAVYPLTETGRFLLDYLITLGLGVVLVMYPNKLVGLIRRLRRAGSPRPVRGSKH